ncbi:hypothetical protein [Pedobacter agri]|uniref:hypothetical protein n=1 Tax=Pedobacter agri TaxID=454586 RepID=UPI0029305CB9|nr:hypothetical protein [Pedobacter agri]
MRRNDFIIFLTLGIKAAASAQTIETARLNIDSDTSDHHSNFILSVPQMKRGEFSDANRGSMFNVNENMITVLYTAIGKRSKISDSLVYKPSKEELMSFQGIYFCIKLPFRITIRQDAWSLTAKATSQPIMILEPTSKNTFSFIEAGIILVFNPSTQRMIFRQAGHEYKFIMQ